MRAGAVGDERRSDQRFQLMGDELRKRRAFFDSYGSRPNEMGAASPPGGIRISCPCCGYPTLGERGGYEICELCWGEDDGQDDADADIVLGGPNHGYSLTEARENFIFITRTFECCVNLFFVAERRFEFRPRFNAGFECGRNPPVAERRLKWTK